MIKLELHNTGHITVSWESANIDTEQDQWLTSCSLCLMKSKCDCRSTSSWFSEAEVTTQKSHYVTLLYLFCVRGILLHEFSKKPFVGIIFFLSVCLPKVIWLWKEMLLTILATLENIHTQDKKKITLALLWSKTGEQSTTETYCNPN